METTICKTPSELTPIKVGQSGIDFKFTPVTKIINRGDIKLLSAIMTIPQETTPGIYGFKIYACPSSTEVETCNGIRNSYGEYDFIVEVK
jgi:hypothetical protein